MLRFDRYRYKLIKALFPFTYGVKRFFILSLLLSMAIIGLTFLTPVFYRIFIDEVVVQGDMHEFIPVVAGYMTILLLGFGIKYVKNYSDNRLNNHVYFKAKHKIFRGMFSHPFSFYDNANIGDLKMNIEEDNENIKTFADTQIFQYSMSWLSLIVSSIFLLSISWKLSLIAVVNIPLTLYCDYVLGSKQKVVVQRTRENNEETTSWLNASLGNWKEIKTLNLQKYEKRKYTAFLVESVRIGANNQTLFVIRELVIPWVKDKFVMELALYFLGGLLIIQGEFTIGLLLVFALYYNILSEAIKSLSNANATLLAQQSITDRILSRLSWQSRLEKQIPLPAPGEIVLENVSFKYENSETEVLHNVNLKIGRGEKVVIVGRSGEGKSTLVKLMTGIYLPSEGTAMFAGVPMNEINPNYLYKKIGFVMQETTLFNMRIKDYFLLVNPKASDDDILNACRKALIDDFIEGLPDRFHTVMGEGGVKLSGGQRQRLILAGQFLRDVDILVFDEATNHLDPQAEDLIYEALDQWIADKTIIYITHREKTKSIHTRQLLVRNRTVNEDASRCPERMAISDLSVVDFR